MLRLRIRELERQVTDLNPHGQANTPPIPSNLATSPPLEGMEGLEGQDLQGSRPSVPSSMQFDKR